MSELKQNVSGSGVLEVGDALAPLAVSGTPTRRWSKFVFRSPTCHLTERKLLIVNDVTGCCRFVADLLPIKCLIINDVTDVADFQTISSKENAEVRIKTGESTESK
jgi:hypothetical protein